jgi:hypothetical protein
MEFGEPISQNALIKRLHLRFRLCLSLFKGATRNPVESRP